MHAARGTRDSAAPYSDGCCSRRNAGHSTPLRLRHNLQLLVHALPRGSVGSCGNGRRYRRAATAAAAASVTEVPAEPEKQQQQAAAATTTKQQQKQAAAAQSSSPYTYFSRSLRCLSARAASSRSTSAEKSSACFASSDLTCHLAAARMATRSLLHASTARRALARAAMASVSRASRFCATTAAAGAFTHVNSARRRPRLTDNLACIWATSAAAASRWASSLASLAALHPHGDRIPP